MALDRFVYWQKDRPTKAQLEKVLSNYVEGAGSVKFKDDRWYCTLRGKPSDPFKGVSKGIGTPPPQYDERWFEVYWHNREEGIKASIDIITRGQDAFTNAVAEGFRQLCLSAWQATAD